MAGGKPAIFDWCYMRRKHNKDEILRYIIEYKMANDGNSPTHRQIMEACGITNPSTTFYILERLEKDGKISFTGYGDARGIKVTGGQWSMQSE